MAGTLGGGGWLAADGMVSGGPPQPSDADAFPPGQGPRFGHGPSSSPSPSQRHPARSSRPVRVRIPTIQVDAPVTGLGMTASGTLRAPDAQHRNLAGWFRDGVPPGARGTAILDGHVDTAAGPAVFYDLGTLHRGEHVEVAGEDGRTAVFTVDAVEVYANDHFPNAKVYGPSRRAELRVITCGGGYDSADGYQGNVVVYAHLTDLR